MLHGGRIVARALKNEGITHVFTLCGGHIQNIYDGCLDEGIRVVDTRHEQTAGHAADGYARVTGKPGVALVTAGPGVTDVVTAVANAQRAGVPMICIGGAGPVAYKHMGSLQDMDHVELMKPITKWSATVTETRRLEEFVTTAFRVATTGVPGPVFLEVPLDILMNFATDQQIIRPTQYRSELTPSPSKEAIEAAAKLIDGAERPMVICGSQLRWSRDKGALERFLAKRPMPAFLNGMARGALAPSHPCFMSRSRRAALAGADVVIVLGTPFDFRVDYGREGTWAKDVKVIQIDLDPEELGRNRAVDVGIPADSGHALAALEQAIAKKDGGDWLATIRADEEGRQGKMRAEIASGATSPPNPLWVCSELAKYVQDDTIVIGDGGDFVATAAYTLPIRWPGLWMDPGPLGTLGVGPGYAMAAKLARPESRVILVYGDGSFGLHGLEFEAMARQGIKVVGVVGNDACWTQIYRGQRDIFGAERTPATKLAYTRYDLVAEAVGAKGFYAETPDQVKDALQKAFECPEPALVNVKIGSSDFRKGAISV
ncbi:thiamine pyrophosphate-binding protein [Sandaracinus amylolyticus]|uniref:Acetolactate synthase large subunit n=1 Tax=Sandaracinus amylolyticus TaxID=927083 RepID=A0A0F6YHF5_9BACT|nr:thiamine pyrophosphate-binding protein [Sandaracinus amylolyticus]AKF05076.1 Acetolactate synthase large subunit [Sandaracinus amylolyticus]